MYPYDGSIVKEWAGASQWRAFRADWAKAKISLGKPYLERGVWALAVYRLRRGTLNKRPNLFWWPIRKLLRAIAWFVEAAWRINLEVGAEIGPGFLMIHGGPCRVQNDTKIGANCFVFHNCTIGSFTGSHRDRPGGAEIGESVVIGCQTSILGPVRIGDLAVVAANSLVLIDVPALATAIGVPAKIIPGIWKVVSKNPGLAEIESAAMGATPVERAVASTPHLVPTPVDSPYDAMRNHARRTPDRCAVSHFHAKGTYEQWSWSELSTHTRSAFHAMNRSPTVDEPVVLFSGRTPECVAVMLAAIGSGRPFTFVNPKWKWPQIQHVLQTLSCRTLYVSEETKLVLEKSAGDVERDGVRLVSIESITAERSGEDVSPNPTADSLAHGAFLFTSGSTGEPKCVCISRRDLFWRAQTEVAWYEITERDVLLGLLPFSFDVGLNQILSAVYAGSETVLLESWMPADILKVAAERNVSGIPCVPSIWQDMMGQNLRFETRDAHRNLRFLTVSGGDLPSRQLDRMHELAPGVGVYKTYGQTESFRTASLRPAEFDSHKSSVGKPFPGVTAFVVRADGSVANRNETGELVHAGLGIMSGYFADETRTNAKLKASPDGETRPANYTGDNAFIDENGYVHLVGRSDQMVKINGNRVYPAEVRNHLCDVPHVRDAIVLAEKDSKGETLLVAFVVTDRAADGGHFKRDLRDRMPGYLVPQCIQFVPDLPRTASGKPDGEALRLRAKSLANERNGIPVDNSHTYGTSVDAVSQRIAEFVRNEMKGDFLPERDRLMDALDSIALMELIAMLEREFRLNIDLSQLRAESLSSPTAMARAVTLAPNADNLRDSDRSRIDSRT